MLSNKENFVMKKYESPRLDIVEIEVLDIITVSVGEPAVLNTWGSITDPVNSAKVNVFG